MQPYDDPQTKNQINLMKQRGLQKLKYYCQMCRKQCPDDNGFKCHVNSESHQRQMRLYSEDPEYFTLIFSREFEEEFMDLMKQRFFSKPVHPNRVYMDLIKKMEHAHMNGTKWTTLSDFIDEMVEKKRLTMTQSQGQTMIQYVDISPEAVTRRKEEQKKQQVLSKQNKIVEDYILQQVQKGMQQTEQQNDQKEEQSNDLQNAPIQFVGFSLNTSKKDEQSTTNPLQEIQKPDKYEVEIKLESEIKSQNNNNQPKKQMKNLDNLLGGIKKIKQFFGDDEQEKQIKAKEQPWILEGIVVKILDNKLKEGKYYKKKAIIIKAHDFVADVEMITTKKEKLKIDQAFLETVIPKIGHRVMVLKPGPFRGKVGKLESIHQDNFSGSIYLDDQDTLVEMPYEYFSKIHESTD